MITCVCGREFKSRRSLGVHKRYCSLRISFEKIEKKWLFHQYIVLEKSTYQIAKEFDYKKSTVYELLKEYKIKTRNKSEAQLGEKNYMYGKMKEKSPVWKGKNAKTNAKHMWMKAHFKPLKKCEKCGLETNVELSFNHCLGDYTRNIDDYEYLCRKCHVKKDVVMGRYKLCVI